MSLIVVDVEADGEIPSLYSMVCFGAVIVRPGLDTTFYGQTRPISSSFNPEALAVSGFSREEHLKFEDPKEVMLRFAEWIKANSVGKPVFISDNPAFDFAWINWYFHYFTGENPFGWSARRIGDLYCGMMLDAQARWKHLREPYIHTHHPVDDALGNAQALLKMKDLGLKIRLK